MAHFDRAAVGGADESEHIDPVAPHDRPECGSA